MAVLRLRLLPLRCKMNSAPAAVLTRNARRLARGLG